MRTDIAIGSYQSGQAAIVVSTGVRLVLCHLCDSVALAVRQADPHATVVLRPDDGRDNQQVDTSRSPEAEADRWFGVIARRLASLPVGTYHATCGICEAWGDVPWRARFETRLCELVQAGLGIGYAALSCPVGNLEPSQLPLFAELFEMAWAVNYHSYLAPGRTALSQEADPWHLWRPLELWLPECRRLGIRMPPILLGEVGTYEDPRSLGVGPDQQARLCVDVAREFGRRARAAGVEYRGGCCFGFGTVGKFSTWDVQGQAAVFAAAIAEDGGGQVPVVGEGFRKCEPYVGPWTEDEIYHANGTPEKTSLAIGARGFAVWRARTNETIAVCDSGEVLADAGNHADGVLRRIRPPF